MACFTGTFAQIAAVGVLLCGAPTFSVTLGAASQGALGSEVAPPPQPARGEGLHSERLGRQGLACLAQARHGDGHRPVPVRTARIGRCEQHVRRPLTLEYLT